MRHRRTARLLASVSTLAFAGALVAACGNDPELKTVPTIDGSTPGDGEKQDGGGTVEPGQDAQPAPIEDGGSVAPADAEAGAVVGDGGTGADCVFNDECQADHRCSETTGKCELGARGTGKAGVTTCTDGFACESGMCIDGNTGKLCTKGCTADKDCPAKLPRCILIAFLNAKVCSPPAPK